ncbi:MAG: Uma2 family endonuclease [Chloroflexia bacterium]|nr:Uma2 family endonuclease [Chloroflexia bacterium]
MASAPVAAPPLALPDEVVVLPRVSWETYTQLVDGDEERRVPRLTYDRGVLELVSPSPSHEEDAHTLTLLVEFVAAVLGIPLKRLGSTTFRRVDLERGFEPDGSFYIQQEAQMRGRRDLDLGNDPPPDLVIEVEASRSAIDKLALFASMGIPEVWRMDGESVAIHVLAGDRSANAEASLAVPVLTTEVLTRLLGQSRTLPSPEWFRAVTEWAVAQRLPTEPEP